MTTRDELNGQRPPRHLHPDEVQAHIEHVQRFLLVVRDALRHYGAYEVENWTLKDVTDTSILMRQFEEGSHSDGTIGEELEFDLPLSCLTSSQWIDDLKAEQDRQREAAMIAQQRFREREEREQYERLKKKYG